MSINAGYFNQLSGTIAGTQSEIIDTSGHQLLGLAIIPTGTLTAGTINFNVGWIPGTVWPLYDANNQRYGLPHGTAGQAYTATAVSVLQPYRYVQLVFDHNQAGRATLPCKIS